MSLICFNSLSYGFNWNKCETSMKGYPLLIDLLISTSQFSTSTGGCSMIGQISHDKKVFVAQNYEDMKVDSARGQGEYLDSYASLAGCNEQARAVFPKILQHNFTKIYGEELDNSPQRIFENIEATMSKNPILSAGCGLKS